jgi:hypothetical protein
MYLYDAFLEHRGNITFTIFAENLCSQNSTPKQIDIFYILTYNSINLPLHICLTLLALFGISVASHAILESNFSGKKSVVHH